MTQNKACHTAGESGYLNTLTYMPDIKPTDQDKGESKFSDAVKRMLNTPHKRHKPARSGGESGDESKSDDK